MAHDEDDFRIRPGKVRDRGGRPGAARRVGALRGRSTSFIGEVHQAIRRAGGTPNRLAGTGRGSGRFNARGRGAAAALTLKDRSAWNRDGSGARTRSRRVAMKARVVKLNPQRGAARGRQYVSAKAVDVFHCARDELPLTAPPSGFSTLSTLIKVSGSMTSSQRSFLLQNSHAIPYSAPSTKPATTNDANPVRKARGLP
jgi:hypothetical protein